jgi:hypothetical protein
MAEDAIVAVVDLLAVLVERAERAVFREEVRVLERRRAAADIGFRSELLWGAVREVIAGCGRCSRGEAGLLKRRDQLRTCPDERPATD